MESKKITVKGARPEGIARLLEIGAEPPEAAPATPEQRKIDWLMMCLAAPPEMGEDLSASVSEADGELLGDLLTPTEAPLADSLLDGQASLETLRTIKEHAKRVHLAAEVDREQREVAKVVYFAAIASALLQHGQRISRYPHARLAEEFGRLAGKPWMAPELVKHFRFARDAAMASAGGDSAD